MKADPFAQLKLLDVQELDSKIDLLRHQRASLPEISELQELTGRRTDVADQARDAQIHVGDLTRAQRKADADVEQVKARRTRDRDRIDRGLVTNPKDLERMQHEMVSLDRRIHELEDAELEVMEELEGAQAELDRLNAQAEELDGSMQKATASRDQKAAKLDDELADTARTRTQTVADMPETLMTLYSKLREQKGGVGAAALRTRRCGGCRLDLNAADLAVMAKAPSDEVLRCEECNRILVRTSESGI